MKNLVTALFLCCALALAQSHPAVAIHNAKIVTVSGSVINKGTVVVRNGLIEAVGENVAVPADAMLVEGEGLTVYPGLIDALSTWGQPGAAPAAATATAGRGGRGTTTAAPATSTVTQAAAPPARGPEDRPQTTSWLKIADEISATDRRIETARGAGFTTAVTFPTRGIFAGQGAVIDLITGEKPGEMIVASPVGQYISIGAGGRGGGGMGRSFPGSLMGYIAYVRQIYLDADHYKLVKDTYAKNPVGMTRPEYDRALEGVLDSPRILLPANRLVEIDRMLHLAADLKQPVILYGGRETFRPEAAALLKKFNAPILLSMRWPEASRDADPDEVDSMRTLETRDKAALAPSVLAEGRRQIRLLLRRPRCRPRPAARRQEGARQRTLPRRRPARPHAFARRNLRRLQSPRLHREGKDRQPRSHARRHLRRPHQSGNDSRGWPQVCSGARCSALRRHAARLPIRG